jgi:hypothetical protein
MLIYIFYSSDVRAPSWKMSGLEGDDETTSEAGAPFVSDAAEAAHCSFGYDSCGAMDLSSCASSKAHDTDDNEDAEDEEGGEEEASSSASTEGGGGGIRRRNAEDARRTKRKRPVEEDGGRGSGSEGEEEDSEDKSVKSLPPKIRNKRRNIKSVIEEERLEAETKAAKAEEQERLNRLAEQQKQLYLEV